MDEKLMKLYAERAVAMEQRMLTVDFIRAALQGGWAPTANLAFECAALAEAVPEVTPIPPCPTDSPTPKID